MIGEEKLDELKPPACPLCGNPDTRMEEDSPSGWCPKCGAAWCNYISLTIKIGEEPCADDASSSRDEP